MKVFSMHFAGDWLGVRGMCLGALRQLAVCCPDRAGGVPYEIEND